MSEIVGFELTPDSSTTLRKFLKHKLAPYLEQFESISAVAGKVSDCKKKQKTNLWLSFQWITWTK